MSKFEQKSALYEKLRFFIRINLALVICGAKGKKWVQNRIFRALFSEIYIKIEVFSSLEDNYTSAPIAQLAACLI